MLLQLDVAKEPFNEEPKVFNSSTLAGQKLVDTKTDRLVPKKHIEFELIVRIEKKFFKVKLRQTN